MTKILFSLMISATTLFATPQAIVFDFGGVMSHPVLREAVLSFLRESFQLSESEFEQARFERREATIKSGKTDTEFWLDYAKKKNIILPDNWSDTFESVLKKAIQANSEMYALVDQLKERDVAIAMLSNVDPIPAKVIREAGLYQPFDPCILSCDTGIKKPAPEAYEMLIERLNLPAQNIVFIDDQLRNIEAAQKLGIDGILFESPEQLRQELQKRGLLIGALPQ